MAKNAQFNGATRLLVQLAAILVTVAVAWGIASHQVGDNTEDIGKKLDKEVFQMYIEQRQKADEKTDKALDKIDGKLDKLIARDTQP